MIFSGVARWARESYSEQGRAGRFGRLRCHRPRLAKLGRFEAGEQHQVVGHRRRPDFALVARDLLGERPLDAIPLATRIALATVEAFEQR
jgi:hypothetical protein